MTDDFDAGTETEEDVADGLNLGLGLELVEFLGSGGFGEVFRGYDNIQGEVAVKVFRKSHGRHRGIPLDDETQKEWLERAHGLIHEGQRLRDAAHDHVVRVHRVGAGVDIEGREAIFLVMELCRGGSLESLYRKGPIPLKRLRQLLNEAALGLAAVHSRQMIHRDLKPGNILIDENGCAKLGDFGLVTADIVEGYAAIGGYTPHLAPEVFDNRLTSVRSDVYAFGMTMYRLMHGPEWWDGNQPVLFDGAPPLDYAKKLQWLPHIPQDWRRFVMLMLHPDTDKRVQTAEAIIDGLNKLKPVLDWTCDYSAPKVVWRRTEGKRIIEATWDRSSPHRHRWYAYSHPASGAGRSVSKGASPAGATNAQVLKGLEEFLQKRN